jgi:flagellar hook-basal body complex protein FliE
MPGPIELQGLTGIKGIQLPKDVELDAKHFDIETGEVQDSFADMLTRAINGVDETMKTSDQNVQNYVSGKTDNVHEVMISMQRAQLSFQLMVEVRNKAIETYNEISRMQI